MTMRVTLSIIPFGDEDKAYEIGRLDIFNKGPTLGQGNAVSPLYRYGVINLTPKDEGLYDKEIFHHRADGAWLLTKRVLEELEITGP